MDARIPAASSPAERRLFEDETGATLDGRAPIYLTPEDEIKKLPSVMDVSMLVSTPIDRVRLALVKVKMDRKVTQDVKDNTVNLARQIVSRYGIDASDVQVVDEAYELWPPPDFVPVSPSYSPTSPSYEPDFGPEIGPDSEAETDPEEEGTPPPAKRTKGPTPVARDEA